MSDQDETKPIGPLTIIHDRNHNTSIMQIAGVLVLPVGAEIELIEPNVNAVVTRVRLLASRGTNPVYVCLDVEVPEKWWDDPRRGGAEIIRFPDEQGRVN